MTIKEAYEALAKAMKSSDAEQAIDQLRQAINADPSLVPAMKEAAERSAIPGLAIAGKAIPA